MRGPAVRSMLAVVLLVGVTFLVGTAGLASPVRAQSTTPVTGSLTGPTVVATNSSSEFHVSGYGGPAVAANGTLVGTITYYATPVGSNLTGVDFTPHSTNFTGNRSIAANLVVGQAAETLSIDIEISSVYQGKNASTNFTYTVTVVQPYVVSATIVNPSNSTVSGFPVYITLDGTVVGQVNISSLISGATFRVTYKYPTLGLSPGWHTFSISLVQQHGLVTFANGQTTYSESVYVTGPAPDYTLWYIAGIVAFFGAIFIFLTRVAARRRGTARR